MSAYRVLATTDTFSWTGVASKEEESIVSTHVPKMLTRPFSKASCK